MSRNSCYNVTTFVTNNQWVTASASSAGLALADRVGDDAARQDATAYVDGDWAAATFVPHYGQLLSLAVVTGNARRCLKYADQLRTQARRATAERAGTARRTRRAA